MKKLLKFVLCGLMVFSAAGCGSKKSSDVDPIAVYGCDVLNVYNWGEYIGEDVISNFEDAYNVRVNYSMFDSNEEMYTTLLGGNAYDILIPSDYMIERLIQENLLQPLDKDKITIFDDLSEGVLNKPYDPDNTYSVPYFWGTVGILYDTTKVDAAKVESMGWDILRDTEYAGDIFMYDSERDSFMVAFKALGYSMNAESDEEIEEAYQWLLELHKTMNPSYVTDEVNDAMINAEKALAVVYSGAAAYIISENPDMAYYEPSQGTNVWTDAMVIPANAKCPALAHEFINFALSYDSMVDSTLTVGYTSSIQSVVDDMGSAGGDFEGNEAYFPRSGYEKDEVFTHNEVLKRKLSELWIKIKMS